MQDRSSQMKLRTLKKIHFLLWKAVSAASCDANLNGEFFRLDYKSNKELYRNTELVIVTGKTAEYHRAQFRVPTLHTVTVASPHKPLSHIS